MEKKVPPRQERYYEMASEEILNENAIELTKGLTQKIAKERQAEFGYNELQQEKPKKWLLFLKQFNNMIIYILLFAALLTLWMGHYSDAIIIALVVIINALIGYYQEINASNALEKIKSMLSTQATVIRGGTRQDIPARELVCGDLVYLEAGDNVPADLRLLDLDNLRIQEASLTGEADSVIKNSQPLAAETPLADRLNMAFASTAVTNGSGLGIVTATAEATEIGKISVEVNKIKPQKTAFMKEIDQLGKGISCVILAVAVLLFSIGLWSGVYSVSILSLAIVTMIVGSVPEGLPATTSVILAMGVSDMAKNKNAIVKTLPAVETLGAVDVIATDKTGTLTKNEMTVQDIYTNQHGYEVSGTGYSPKGDIYCKGKKAAINQDADLLWLLLAGYEANDTTISHENGQWLINGEPTDGSFLTLYHKALGLDQPAYREIDKIPFDSDYRYNARLSENEQGERLLFIKGSPDKLFPMAQNSDDDFDLGRWEKRVDYLTAQGKRVVAVGMKKVQSNQETVNHDDFKEGLDFLGLVGIIDPPREEVIETLKIMRKAGVEVKMITGDHPMTAKAIAQKLGLAKEIKVITGAELERLTVAEMVKEVPEYQVFARMTPKNKLDIIEALQKSGRVTAMTGDGVNDAPALKKADIGVSMGIKGTDVAKDSAEMILADDNFSTMSIAIREGRRIYENIKKSILFLLPTSFAEGLIIAFTILAQREMPLQATQMLWINMVSAITIQFAFIFEPAEKGLMERAPRKTGASMMNKHDILQMAYISILMAVVSLFAYEWLLIQGADRITASTMVVNIMVISKIFYLFNIRTSELAFSKAFFTNKKAFLIIALMILLQLILTYMPFMQKIFYTEPLTVLEWGIAIAAGFVVLAAAEIDKVIRKYLKRKKLSAVKV